MILTASLSPVLPAQTRSPAVQGGRAAIDFAGSFAQVQTPDAALAPVLPLLAAKPDATVLQNAAAPGNVLPMATPAADPPAVWQPGIAPQAPALAVAAQKSPLLPANALTPDAVEADPPLGTANPAAIATPVARIARPTPFVGPTRGARAKDQSATDGTGTTEADTDDAAPSVAMPVDSPVILSTAPPASPITSLAIVDTVKPDDSAAIAAAPAVLSPSLAGPAEAKPQTAETPAPAPGADRRLPPAVTPGQMLPDSPAPLRPTATATAATSPSQTPPVPAPGVSPVLALPAAGQADAALTPATGNVDPRTPFVRLPTPPQTADTRLPLDQMPPIGLAQTAPAAMAAEPTMPAPATPPAVAPPLAGTVETARPATPGLPQQREATALPVSPDTPISTPRWISTGATTPVALAVPMPAAVQPQPGTVASASQVFGAAIRAATKPRDERDAADPSMISSTAGTPVSAPTIATAAAQQAPLDMRQERWPHAMIERIEILRDAADAGDTRIRLVPDALGAIDVALKQDGDTVHVHFHAEQGATRALLQEAQPRLVELAEARGLKLGQGGLGNNAGAGNGQPRAQATPQASNRTPSPPASATIVAAPEDTRIA
ncbi:conserved hypothetical protein [Sphingomonas aurantiaca]|uniref:Flagellar hook-length control protein-like C-terminal domain-containing protein n=1 Tax=Sphingomonas aurantiaca TaxID=185949 RepID=A0A5E7YMQ7_9SPHN|nr:flagellar hook-length control protein FliK [Sphingomonas aurantiaca]VVT06621.1 conserved hypothetical protein [Sphingomonas aurantiaca]